MQMVACKVCVKGTLILDPNLLLCPPHHLTMGREQEFPRADPSDAGGESFGPAVQECS